MDLAESWCRDAEKRWAVPAGTLDARKIARAAGTAAPDGEPDALLGDVFLALADEHPNAPPVPAGLLTKEITDRIRKAAVRGAYARRDERSAAQRLAAESSCVADDEDGAEPAPMMLESSSVEVDSRVMHFCMLTAALLLTGHYIRRCRDQRRHPKPLLLEHTERLRRYVDEKKELPPREAIHPEVWKKHDRLAKNIAKGTWSVAAAWALYTGARAWARKTWLMGGAAAALLLYLIIRPPPQAVVPCEHHAYGCKPAVNSDSMCNPSARPGEQFVVGPNTLHCKCPNPNDDNKGTWLKRDETCESVSYPSP